jgi:hypothetical protein
LYGIFIRYGLNKETDAVEEWRKTLRRDLDDSKTLVILLKEKKEFKGNGEMENSQTV